MFEFFSEIVEHLAPYVVATHLLFLLVVAIVSGVAVAFLSPYLARFAIIAISSLGRSAIFVTSSLGRCVGFVFSWQPEELVGASRDQRQRLPDPDSSASHGSIIRRLADRGGHDSPSP